MTRTSHWQRIGEVGVDSGQLMVCDPCYLHNWRSNNYDETIRKGDFSYAGACNASLADELCGELDFPNTKAGSGGAAVVFRSGYGDGVYPVYAKRNKDGCIVEIKIVMDGDEEDEQ